MKKTTLFLFAAFLVAIANAFTTNAISERLMKKRFNTTGWAGGPDNCVSATTDQANCTITATTANCTFTIGGHFYSPIYDSKADCGDPTRILKHN